MRDIVESDQETIRGILAVSMGRVVNHYHKYVRRRMRMPFWQRLSKRVATANARKGKNRDFICGTRMMEVTESSLYYRHARLLLLVLSRGSVYIVNNVGQVPGFREIGRQFGKTLRRIDNDRYQTLREIGAESFDELNLDDQLICEHFSIKAENFIATVAEEEGLYFFFISAGGAPHQRLV
jgi:hypothetical protein